MMLKGLILSALIAPAVIAAPQGNVDQVAAPTHVKYEKVEKGQVQQEKQFKGQKLYGLAHKALKKGETVPVKFKGEVVGYLLPTIEESSDHKTILVKFVKELPGEENDKTVEPPAETDPITEDQPADLETNEEDTQGDITIGDTLIVEDATLIPPVDTVVVIHEGTLF